MFLCVLFALGVSVFAADKPNILLILADDLGYGDVGCYNDQNKVPLSPSLGLSEGIVAALLEAGVDPAVENNEGKKP